MEVSGVNTEIPVRLIKSDERQQEKVLSTILSGIDQSSQNSREFFSTGHSLNVQA